VVADRQQVAAPALVLDFWPRLTVGAAHQREASSGEVGRDLGWVKKVKVQV
jgi:hypothetical protein